MKKFLIFLISTLIILVGCQSNKVNNDVYFDKIASISWLKPDENEVNFNKEDSEKILDILSKAELSSDNEERDGGLWLKAYTDDNEKYSIMTRPPKVRPKKSNFGGRYFYVKIQL